MTKQHYSIIFILAGLLTLASGACLLKRNYDSEGTKKWYKCFKSYNYISDLNKASNDIIAITFSTSIIPIVHDDSFFRFKNDLIGLSINYCGVKKIEDYAFRNLTNVRFFSLALNKLEVVSAAWFRDLHSLILLNLNDNRIKHIEPDVYPLIPKVTTFNIAHNELRCLRVDLLSHLKKLRSIEYEFNPWSWRCQALLMQWLSEHGITYRLEYDGLKSAYNVTRNCIESEINAEIDDEVLNSCVESRLTDRLLQTISTVRSRRQ